MEMINKGNKVNQLVSHLLVANVASVVFSRYQRERKSWRGRWVEIGFACKCVTLWRSAHNGHESLGQQSRRRRRRCLTIEDLEKFGKGEM